MTTTNRGAGELTGEQPGTFRWVWRKVQPRVRRLTQRLLSSPAEADEATEETALLLWKTIAVDHKLAMPQNEAELADIERWVCRVAHNYCIDVLRDRNRGQRTDESLHSNSASEALTEERCDARRALKALNLSQTEEDMLLGIQQGAADARTRQQVKRLRKRLMQRLLEMGFPTDGDGHGT